ncbi:ThiF family adenylyltransferase [uncultured Erythrobacter sp.]|uniref:ThiF family adenylyltransferase n=1 Tax=uncultured Erythrobacter sp. TaxID=263913 RepID=UPI002627AFAC|nr:ThiF family adenylyltransferase [uncultured Erythrobacter sp.]
MLDSGRSLEFRRAALELEAQLRLKTGVVPERLSASELRACYGRRRWVKGWRIPIEFSDENVRQIDIVANEHFPLVPVRTALRERPPFLTWPHVEEDGTLCLLPNLAECDPDNPVSVAENLLNRSVRLIEELLEGAIVNRDFKEEFLTYWAYDAHGRGEEVISLIDPAPPSRTVKLWRGRGLQVIGEDLASVEKWVRNRFTETRSVKCEDAAFLWSSEPPLPSEYPQKGADVLALARSLGAGSEETVRQVASENADSLVILLGARGRGGPGLVAMHLPGRSSRLARKGREANRLSKGFRSGQTPRDVLVTRTFGQQGIRRTGVARADAAWVHGRGADGRSATLLNKTIVVIGCGSVGAPIACLLARAGVGKIVLVDPDVLSWANIGRHPLGAAYVGKNKAQAMQDHLASNFPHLDVEFRDHDVRSVVGTNDPALADADLIISATGSWSADHELNRWHLENGRAQPVLYGWTEAHACAGHGVVVAHEDGCIQCHMSQVGRPDFVAIDWQEGADANLEEPACGAHYQPYGPVELEFINAMLGELALDCLLNAPSQSLHRVSLARKSRIGSLGGEVSKACQVEIVDDGHGPIIFDREWPVTSCKACGDVEKSEAA